MVGMEKSRGGRRGGMGKRKGEEKSSRRPFKKFQKFEKRTDRGRKQYPGKSRSQRIAEEDTPSANLAVPASEDETEVIPEENDTAYSALLHGLQAMGGSFAEAYAQRQREQMGASSASSSDEEDELEESEGGVDVNPDENPEENPGDGLHVQSHAPELFSLDGGEKESAKEKQDISTEKREENNIGDQNFSQSEDDSEEDVIDARVASGGQASSCEDPFKKHVGHQLVDRETAKLLEQKNTFHNKFPAAGVQGGTWVSSLSSTLKDEKNLQAYSVKKRLQDSWHLLYNEPSWGDFESERQCQFFSLCSSYQDVLHTRKVAFKEDGQSDGDDLSYMDAYTCHILNHVLKTRDVIVKNNEKLHRASLVDVVADPPRDQGFTRPKVLVLLPFRSSALKFVGRILKLAPNQQKANIENKSRFFDEFGVEDTNEAEDETLNQKDAKSTKPADFRALFTGNNDDHFRIGIQFTRKSIKLYSEFYSSDIIVASPVGLITRIGEAEAEKDKDIDFLSSIEIAVIDYADVIQMQNWSHAVSVFEHLNRIPVQQHGTDFMRIRDWYLNGFARYFRQSIILSSFSDAGINALFHRACVNHEGKVKLRTQFDGLLSKIVLQVRQVYEKIDCSLITEVDDARFEFFTKQIYPRLKNSLQTGTMIYTRSYFDFVRLRNFLKSESASFCLLGEYTKQSDVSRARSWFYHGKRKVLLYTERAHFFNRYKIRGIKDLIFYSLPDHPQFYVELVNLLEGNDNPSCTTIFSQFDNLQLERVVGSARTKRMLSSPNKLFMFC